VGSASLASAGAQKNHTTQSNHAQGGIMLYLLDSIKRSRTHGAAPKRPGRPSGLARAVLIYAGLVLLLMLCLLAAKRVFAAPAEALSCLQSVSLR
jgi:hypothetical protein